MPGGAAARASFVAGTSPRLPSASSSGAPPRTLRPCRRSRRPRAKPRQGGRLAVGRARSLSPEVRIAPIHACALTILEAIGDIRKVLLWLGHQSLQTTEMNPSHRSRREAGHPLGLAFAGSRRGTHCGREGRVDDDTFERLSRNRCGNPIKGRGALSRAVGTSGSKDNSDPIVSEGAY